MYVYRMDRYREQTMINVEVDRVVGVGEDYACNSKLVLTPPRL